VGISNSKAVIAETGAELKAVLLTHSHFDHVNLAGKLVDEFKAHVYISGLEAEYYNFRCKNLHFLIDMSIYG
jgi:glyoxylase-like metal-dependent hydrolase (beta-lactamase superfamily II)